MIYSAPKEGFYSVATKIIKSVPTGQFKTVRNPDRLFFQYWKPKFVQREEFKTVFAYEGRDVVYLKQGETVVTSDMFRVEGPK